MNVVLVVDDEEGIREILTDILEDEGYRVVTAADGIAALTQLEAEPVDCVLLDVWLPGKGGLDVLAKIRESTPRLPVIVISGHGSIDMAVKAVKMGAFDFLEKPLSLDRVTTLVRNAIELERLRRENEVLRASARHVTRLVGQSAPMRHIRTLIEQCAAGDARVLISGENGTGKEMVARELHAQSRRRDRPFIAVNCAAIPDTLIESELFGHERGAFTGAHARRKGRFEQAHGGTLFLDEIADMSAGAQAKVLRVIQEMRIERVGGEESIAVDVRLVAATNKDLPAMIAAGTFREDLFFRLNVVPIHMPSLRDRADDIPLLVRAFFEELGAASAKRIDPQAMRLLMDYRWPGNIRELKNFVERATIMVDSDTVTAADVERLVGARVHEASRSPIDEYRNLTLNDAKDRFERELIEHALRAHDNNISRAAQELGIYPSNLHAKVRKFGIRIDR